MKITHAYRGLLLFSLSVISMACLSADLLTVYQDALLYDPSYKAAEATFLSKKEGVSQQIATLLPQLSLAGNHTDNRTWGTELAPPSTQPLSANSHTRLSSYSLKLTQKLFDFSNFENVTVEEAKAKAAAATFAQASESLIQRTATAYFAVLQAQDGVTFSKAKEQALYRQYDEANQRFKVGLNTLTDVYQARASYEGASADLIAANNSVVNASENLRAITGHLYPDLLPLKQDLLLQIAKLDSMEQWVQKATQHNYTVIAARYLATAQKRAARAAFGGHLPTLDFSGSYDNINTTYAGYPPTQRTRDVIGSLDLTVPLFAGGGTSSQVRQARFNYQQAMNDQDYQLRLVQAQTRQDFNSIVSGLSQIAADKRTVQFDKSALEGAKVQYQVGTKAMLDILVQQQDLFDAQRRQARDRYAYLSGLLQLKEDAGALTVGDLKAMNQQLGFSSFIPEKPQRVMPLEKRMPTVHAKKDEKGLKKALVPLKKQNVKKSKTQKAKAFKRIAKKYSQTA